MSNSSICLIDKILSSATTPGSNSNEGELHIPESSKITETLPLDCFVSYQDTYLRGRSYSSTEMQSVYFTASAEWAIRKLSSNFVWDSLVKLNLYFAFVEILKLSPNLFI